VASGQGAVPHDADAPERARVHLPLRLVGVGPAPVSRPHLYRIPWLYVKTQRHSVPLQIHPRPEGQGFLRKFGKYPPPTGAGTTPRDSGPSRMPGLPVMSRSCLQP
jgi:hypothetical protein